MPAAAAGEAETTKPAAGRLNRAAPSGRAWAVGFYLAGTSTLTLIERWNGTSWRVVSSPNR